MSDSTSMFVLIGLTVITSATPLVFAAIGELVVEKSGVLNLGVEGMMLAGAVSGFAVAHSTGSAVAGVVAGIVAGMALSLVFAFLTLHLRSSQVATGLALTIFGVGLTALLGQPLVGVAYEGIPKIAIPFLSDIPILGPLLFQHDLLVYGSILLVVCVSLFLRYTRAGLIVRAVGDSPEAAHALGYRVIFVRYLATLFGGACAGLAGCYLSMAYAPMWAENMSAGRGWIALALVVFATWQPSRLLFGAYLFGGITILQLHVQAIGFNVPSQLMSMLPYIATIIVLVLISRDRGRIRRNAPASIGVAFHPTK